MIRLIEGEPMRLSGSRKSLTLSPHHDTRGILGTHLSASGTMIYQGGREGGGGSFGKILASI